MAAACRSLQQEGKGELQPYEGCGDPLAACRGGPAVLLPRQASSAPPPEMSSSSGSGSGRSATEARALKIHSEAERRRRERINAHLAALRRMVPDAKQVINFCVVLPCSSAPKHFAAISFSTHQCCEALVREISVGHNFSV